ncbi:MAG TPA: hypothetical protein PK265_00640 [Candidatus Saccharibacteria bacterium]|nr:hypothetical protein [Candidatus Saccharibacteria bacterium]HRQ97819.1 hypothetical protein [Candidatus Saccharibacteria bacterium]
MNIAKLINKLMVIRNQNSGFTIIEMLIVAPIVILFIGAFIAAIVGMTGDVLTTRGSNMLTYSVQDTLNRIEQDVNSSTGFLATNNIPVSTPQGYDNLTTPFTNVSTTNGNMLILNVYATTKNPIDADSQIVYTKNQPNGCSDPNINTNPPVLLNVVYFVKDNTLYRRVIAPSFYDTVGCSVPWQNPSCAQGQTGSQCKSTDIKLLSGINTVDDFKIDYYATSSSTTPNSSAIDTGLSDSNRQTALQSTKSVRVTINATSVVAGRTFTQTGNIRANSQNNNIGTTSNTQALQITSNPSDSTVNAGANATFTTSASGTSPTVQWQQSTDNGSSWANISGATSSTLARNSVTVDMDGYQYRAVFTNSFGSATTESARLGVNDSGWHALPLSSGWTFYNNPFNTPEYRRTSSGIITLKGLIKKSSGVVLDETFATLPASYRPDSYLLYTTSTNANVYSKIRIHPDGTMHANKADAGWLSLDGIQFIPDNGKYEQIPLTPLYNGWAPYVSVYGSGYEAPSYTVDDIGRVYLQGLVTGGTVTDGTLIARLPSNLLPSLYMHIPAANNNYSLIGVSANQGIVAKGGSASNGYLATQAIYYPASVGTWTDIPLSNGWVTYNASTFSTPQCIKASDGLVSLKGLIRSGTATAGTVIGTLPVSCRPNTARGLFGVASNLAYGRLDVYPTGELVINAGSNSYFSLDGVTYYGN